MTKDFTPAQFVAKWSRTELTERAASQEHFIDLCRLLGQPTPAEHDATGAEYAFEKGGLTTGSASRGAKGNHGFADVWWHGKFAWEYKRKGKYRDLTEAYRQLCQYREALENPPLLIVSDIARTEIHTNFTGTAKQIHTIKLEKLAEPASLDLLRRVFTDPDSFKPTVTSERITEEIAQQFSRLAQSLRNRGHDPQVAAHFLMKCMFCLFAEDVELLPPDLFKKVLTQWHTQPEKLTGLLDGLFDAMRTGGAFGAEPIDRFNGGLFDESPALAFNADEIGVLILAAKQDWSSVEPAIFGTLFERSLDPSTRAQIGAHYTSREDIMLVVEPVIMAPLRREWQQVKADVDKHLERRRAGKTKQTKDKADKAIEKGFGEFVHRLASIRILDPACGSGNFLYVAIQQLLDLEKEVITYAARPEISLGLFPQVRPTQLHGIEIKPYAAELAQVVIWIGYLQWMRDNGFIAPRNPILEPIQTIECRDAILEFLPGIPPGVNAGARASDAGARAGVAESPPEPPHSSPEPPHSCGADSANRQLHEDRDAPRDQRRGSAKGRGGNYLLTWTTYGTWLPGDERGFVGRVPDDKGGHVIHNLPGEPYDADEPRLRVDAKRKLKGPVVRLIGKHARVCIKAFHEVCERYDLTIYAGAIMANHVHLVVSSAESEGPRLLNLFKGVSSRRLGQAFGRQPSGSWWTTGGSRRLLPNERAFDHAVNYVRNQEHMLAACETPPPGVNAADIPPGVNAGARASKADPQPDSQPEPPHSSPEPPHSCGADSANRQLHGVRAVPAQWPDADFIIGNPPFLGSKLFRQQGLGDKYIEAMYEAFDIPNTSDLCCYWFEQARHAVSDSIKYSGGFGTGPFGMGPFGGAPANVRVGLLATQGIRGGDNRTVLQRIKETGDIFMAWSDRDWILDGAAVHVSIVGFDGGLEDSRLLDARKVASIHANLSSAANLTTAVELLENSSIYLRSPEKGAKFEVPYETARMLLSRPNPNGRPMSDVVKPWINGGTLVKGRPTYWIIDFHEVASEGDAALYESAYLHIRDRVYSFRQHNRYEELRKNWWRFRRAGEAVREAAKRLPRILGTTMTAKHRIFAWVSPHIQPDKGIPVFARADDYFFGVLHSSIHELWARRMGTQLREAESGFRYTPTTCFETFPLPWPPGEEPTDHDAYQRISEAAKELNEQRERWLNPPEWIAPIAAAVDAEDDFADVPADARPLIRHSAIMARAAKDAKLKKRTLTNLYNERPTWLRLAHERLDRAVLAAYAAVDPEGDWQEDWAEVWIETGAGGSPADDHPLAERRGEVDQKVLANLLRLNMHRAGR